MIGPVPATAQHLPGDRPLDPDRPATDEPRPTPEPGPAPAPGPAAPPPGLKRQAGATRDALISLARAHIDLAKAEAAEIGDEIKVVAAAVGVAVAAVIFIAFLVPIGIALFLGEWLFGSLGWGVLHGAETMAFIAITGVLAVLRAGRPARAIAIGTLVGVLVAVLFGTNAPNMLYRIIADQFGTGTDPGPIALVVGAGIGAAVIGLLGAFSGARNGTGGDAVKGLFGGALLGVLIGALLGGLVRLAVNEASRPMVVGILIVGGVVGLVGLVLGARSGGLGSGLTGLVTGLVVGGAVGAFTAITFTWHVAIAIGIAIAFAVAIGLMLADVATRGIDTEALKQRFYPQATIDTTKETIEWAKARIPRGPRS